MTQDTMIPYIGKNLYIHVNHTALFLSALEPIQKRNSSRKKPVKSIAPFDTYSDHHRGVPHVLKKTIRLMSIIHNTVFII
jgi:hypothetical protein